MDRQNTFTAGKRRGGPLRAIASVLAIGIATPLFAETPAGTNIANTAAMTFSTTGQPVTLQSNTVTVVSAEILDVAIVAERPAVTVQASASVAVPFVVTNSGNGTEAFVLGFASDRSSVSVARVAIDVNKDGVYQADSDTLLVAGTPITLPAGQSTRVFVLVDGAQVGGTTAITATATAKTGSGPAGTVFAGAGDNGSDAVVGKTGATATASSTLSPAAGQPSLTKSQSVFAPDGSARAIPGAIITYTLAATFTGATRGVAIDDPIPAGTAYVPGSLTLDTKALSDAADGDAGNADATAIHVGLGDVAAAGTRTIQFSVKIL